MRALVLALVLVVGCDDGNPLVIDVGTEATPSTDVTNPEIASVEATVEATPQDTAKQCVDLPACPMPQGRSLCGVQTACGECVRCGNIGGCRTPSEVCVYNCEECSGIK